MQFLLISKGLALRESAYSSNLHLNLKSINRYGGSACVSICCCLSTRRSAIPPIEGNFLLGFTLFLIYLNGILNVNVEPAFSFSMRSYSYKESTLKSHLMKKWHVLMHLHEANKMNNRQEANLNLGWERGNT